MKSFDSAFQPSSYSREIVHSDLYGKLRTSTHGSKYFCAFIDQHSRYTHVVGIKEKGHTGNVVEQYKKFDHVGKYFKNGLERLHTDGGVSTRQLKSICLQKQPQKHPNKIHLRKELIEHLLNRLYSYCKKRVSVLNIVNRQLNIYHMLRTGYPSQHFLQQLLKN